MPRYYYRIEGGNEAAGFEATIGIFAKSESMAQAIASGKAGQIASLMDAAPESITVTLVDEIAVEARP